MKITDRAKLNKDEKLVKSSDFKAGNLGQKEREYYDILNSDNEIVGRLVYKEDSDIKPPFHTSYSITKYNLQNEIIFTASWGD